MRIRVVGTGSGKKAIQVVSKRQGKLTVHRHIGTFETDEQKRALQTQAKEYIKKETGQSSLFDLLNSTRTSEIEITESKPLFLYQFLSRIYDKIGFNTYENQLIKDLVIARLYSPTSKREVQEVLSEEFGRKHSLKSIYRHLKKGINSGLKEVFQKALIQFSKEELKDGLRIIFYDVTTLYFESTARKGLRDLGFSKDHRPQETQIVLGLVVNQQGFPLYFDVFSGKTFEGHTFIPVIEKIRDLLGNPELIVVADAAMISQENIQKLIQKEIGFIVGARLGNLPKTMIDLISDQLLGQDGKVIEIPYREQRLICDYSSKRAAKDRSDRQKQITKAQLALSTPSRLSSRLKFVKNSGTKYTLNTDLLKKSENLEGLKGYLTNTTLADSFVIHRYKNLWKIEKAFRITKSDLQARPIFHRLDESIISHIVIVFAGLAISKFIELETGFSTHKMLKLARKILTHTVFNPKTGETSFISTSIHDPLLKQQIDTLISLGH